MKSIIFSAIIICVVCIACGGKQGSNTTNAPGTHQHADGSIHQDHGTQPQQEEFNVSSDTVQTKSDTSNMHKHDDHDHPHPH